MTILPALLRHYACAEIARGRAALARFAGIAAAYAVAAVIAVVGLQALTIAGYFALAEEIKPPLAALATAAVAFLVAGAIVLGVHLAGRRVRRRRVGQIGRAHV